MGRTYNKVKDGSIKSYIIITNPFEGTSSTIFNTVENQPISPNPNGWIAKRRCSSYHLKFAKLAVKTESWKFVRKNAFWNKHTSPHDCRLKIYKKPARSHSAAKDLGNETCGIGICVLVYVEGKVNRVYSFMIATYQSIDSSVRCCSMISCWRRQSNYL